ncbi:MAG: zinc ribbon domain-containing protein [Mycobacterium sp.]|nr:zinc ribbon domain-containing protein [Mycobacterium sp.]
MSASSFHRECQACRAAVPWATFCGECGANLEAPVTTRSILLRPRVFAAAPGEALSVPRITSTLLPRLAAPARRPFRLALALLLVTMIGLAVLRANVPMGVVSVLGGPAIFVLYMWQADAFRDIPARALVIAGLTGAGTAVAWWVFAGRLLSSSFGVTAAAGQALLNALASVGLTANLGGAVLMVLAPVVVRLLRIPVRDCMDGFVIGAFGTLTHMAAASITWMMPQIVAGLLDPESAGRLFEDAITYGVIDPLISVSLGGLVGLSLWFTPNPAGPQHRKARWALTLCTVSAAALYAGVWLVDALAPPLLAAHQQEFLELAVNLVLALLAVLTARFGVQIALLHAAPGPTTDQPLLCVECEKVVPDMAFCPACGSASLASSSTSRRLRRESAAVREPGLGAPA